MNLTPKRTCMNGFLCRSSRFRLIAGCAVLYVILYFVIAASTPACEQIPEVRDCDKVFSEYTLLSMCLYNCSIEKTCRNFERYIAAGWDGGLMMVVDDTISIKKCSNLRVTVVEVGKETSKKWIWCDKINFIRMAGEKVLYVDADLVPGRCLNQLMEPTEISLFEDAICMSCNTFNAGLVWVPHQDSLTRDFLADWESICRTNPLAVKRNLPDDQVALDILIKSSKYQGIPFKLPYTKVRYMNAILWGWIPGPVLWHYTHTVRKYCSQLNL